MTDVAFAAGFASVRQFNDTIREVFAMAPRELRRRAAPRGRVRETHGDELTCGSPTGGRSTAPACSPSSAHARCPASRSASTAPSGAACGCRGAPAWPSWPLRTATCARRSGSTTCAISALRSSAADACSTSTPTRARSWTRSARDELLGPLVRAAPGRRVPGHVDGAELAVRAVIGQQVSVAGAATTAGRLAAEHGEPLEARSVP